MKRLIIFLIICAFCGALYVFSENVTSGTGALSSVTTGDENVSIGTSNLSSLTIGYGNTAVGAYAGRSVTTVRGGVYLGYGAGVTNTSAHKLFIQTMFYPDYGIFGDFSTGYFGVNTTSPTTAWTVSGTATQDTTISARFLASINGSASDAVFSRSTDKDTGFYFYTNTGNRIGVTAKGTQVALLDSAGVGVQTGTYGAPTFHNLNDRDTGLYWLTATGNRLGITAKGASVAIFDSTGVVVTKVAKSDTVNTTNSVATGYNITNGASIMRGGLALTGSTAKTINFAGMTPDMTDPDNALLAYGTWNDEVDVGTQTAHFVPYQVHLHSTTSAPYDIAAMRLRVDTDGANTENAVQVLQIRSSIADNVASAGAFGAGMSIDGAMEVLTGEMVVGGFSMAGAYKPTSATNPVTILQAANWNTYAGTSVTQIADFYQNGAGNTVDDILRLNVIAGTATDGLHVSNTSGTMTNGIKLSGTIGTDITLQNAETIKNTLNGTVEVGGKLAVTGATTGLMPVHAITAAADTFYAVTSPYAAAATPCITGTMFIARPLAQKSTLFLESAVAGAWFDLMVADADSLRVVAASGDSILTSAGVASRSVGTVAGTIRFIATDTVRWIMMNAIGTWTQDAGVL